MAKDVNIHIKTPGAQEAKEQLNQVGTSAKHLGETTEQAGSKGARGLKWISDGLKTLAGPLGFAALVTAAASAAKKIAEFFDDLKKKVDEAVTGAQTLRAAYDDLFEAFGAFDEKSREQLTKQTNLLLRQTGITQELGLPVVNAYARQFRATMQPQAYAEGLEGMLGYAARHGGGATPDLISLMAGWGMTTPQQQGEFRRMIAAGAEQSGLTDAEVIMALARGLPTIKTMGWSPQQAVESVAVLAAGEAGRKRAELPATTIQALGAPQEGAAAKYKIRPQLFTDPQKLLDYVRAAGAKMSPQQYYAMLTDIYGTTGAAGVAKLLSAETATVESALRQAAGPQGMAAEAAEERARMTTLEARSAAATATARQYELDLSEDEENRALIRTIGKAYREYLRRRRPVKQWMREAVTIGEEAEVERAAYQEWLDSLSPEEHEQVIGEALGTMPAGAAGRYRLHPELFYWNQMSPAQQYGALTGGPHITNIHYHSETIYNPRVGEAVKGPRVTRDIP